MRKRSSAKWAGANDGRCEATSRSGERCKKPVAPGSTVCRSHGALAGAPIKHGRYSKYLPTRLRETYGDFEADPELISMRRHAALLETMVIEHLRKLGDDSPAELWGELAMFVGGFPKLVDEFEAAVGPLADDRLKASLGALRQWHDALMELVHNGLGARRAEADLRELVQEQAQIAKQETRRQAALAKALTDREVAALQAVLVDSIIRHVDDERTRRAIATDLVRALGGGPS